MAEEMRALGYICPHCGKAVYGERTRFALNAAAVALVCGCGYGELTAEPEGDAFRVTVPCGVCGGEHRAEISRAAMTEGRGVGLACPKRRQLCCYIGKPAQVQAALRELELTVEKGKSQGEEVFADSVIMYEILSELKEIATRKDGITCSCGSKSYGMEIHSTYVDLVCKSCGAKLRIPAATDEDLDRLCCRMKLQIKSE